MRPTATLTLGVLLLVGCSDGATTATSAPTGVFTPNATVLFISDGDTIGIEIDGVEERVRLIGIDTPETKKPDTPVQCFGLEATAFTESLLPEGTALYVERDVEARDGYDRLLAYVYRSDDGLFVNLELVAQGFARPLTFPPNVAHADQFVTAARSAEAADLGLWSRCTG